MFPELNTPFSLQSILTAICQFNTIGFRQTN